MIDGDTVREAHDLLSSIIEESPVPNPPDFQKTKRVYLISDFVDRMDPDDYLYSVVYLDDNDKDIVIQINSYYSSFSKYFNNDFFVYIKYIDRLEVARLEEDMVAVRFVIADVFSGGVHFE